MTQSRRRDRRPRRNGLATRGTPPSSELVVAWVNVPLPPGSAFDRDRAAVAAHHEHDGEHGRQDDGGGDNLEAGGEVDDEEPRDGGQADDDEERGINTDGHPAAGAPRDRRGDDGDEAERGLQAQ